MKYFIFSLILFLLPQQYAFAQAQDNTFGVEKLRHMSHYVKHAGIRQRRTQKYKGSPYFSDWQQGYVLLESARSKPIILRYNMRQNSVEFSRNKKIYKIAGEQLKGFVIKTKDGNITFKNGFQTDKDHITPNTLLRVIYEGKVKLLAHHTSKLMKNLASYGTANTLNKFINHTHYLLCLPNNSCHEIKLNKRDIFHVITEDQIQLKSYAKQQHLNFDKESDLKRILSYYDNLTTESD